MNKDNKTKKYVIRIIGIVLSALISGININIFVRVGGLVPGGFSGISILIQRCFERFLGIAVPYSPIYYAFNIIPIYIGFKYIGRNFTLFSCLHVFLSGVFTDLIPYRFVTYDMLLIAVFGGIISGISAALVLSVDASGGGTDFISMYLSQKRGIDSFNIILGFNVIMLCIAGALFGWQKALYSIIYQYVVTQVLRVFYKKFQQDTLMIVTDMPEQISAAIDEVTHHGATIIEAKGAHEMARRWIVYSVVSASESRSLLKSIRLVDPAAFVNVISTQEVGGRFYRARQD